MAELADLGGMVEGFTDTEFVIGDTTFTVVKFGAMEGWRILERIRHEFAKTNVSLETAGMDSAGAATLLRSILGLDPLFVEGLRIDLFKMINFRNSQYLTPIAVAGSEDGAFEGLEPVAIYEVMLRSLAVNFTDSFSGLVSRIGGVVAAEMETEE